MYYKARIPNHQRKKNVMVCSVKSNTLSLQKMERKMNEQR